MSRTDLPSQPQPPRTRRAEAQRAGQDAQRAGQDLQRAGRIASAAVAAAFTIPIGELRATTRRPKRIAFARQSAMYLAHVAFGLNYTDVGLAFDRDRTTAAHACRVVEDRRVDSDLDARLALLEHHLRDRCGLKGVAA